MRQLLIVAALAAALGCDRSPPPQEIQAAASARLPAADSAHATLDAVLVQLPDSGGFVVNGETLPQDSIPARLAAVFSTRPEAGRVVLVVDNPARRADAQWLSRAARMGGGAAFDAELSGVQAPAAP